MCSSDLRADSLSLTEEVSQFSTSTSSGVFSQQYVGERDSVLSVASGMYRERPDSKEGRFRCSGLNLGSCFMSQEEGMSESCVKILEETLVPHLIWTRGLTSLDTSRGLWSSRLLKLKRLDSS